MRSFLLLLTLCALASSAPAQQGALSGKRSEAGAEWLIGEWTFASTWKTPDGTQGERTFVYHWVDAKTVRVVLYEGRRYQGDTTTHVVMLKRTP